ncbi:MAG: signal peptidase II [Balneolaceae bacterium]
MKSQKFFILFTPVVLVWAIDQLTKQWVRYSLELHRYELIEGWLAFNYTQNPGMALGMDWISTPTISVIAILATIAIFFYILKTMHRANFAYLFCMGLILGGAIGNITDRIVMGIIEGYGGVLHGHVIDFIHFTLSINDTPVFPYIFNVADMAISTAIIAMIIFHKWILPIEESQPEEINGEEREESKDEGQLKTGRDKEDRPDNLPEEENEELSPPTGGLKQE